MIIPANLRAAFGGEKVGNAFCPVCSMGYKLFMESLPKASGPVLGNKNPGSEGA